MKIFTTRLTGAALILSTLIPGLISASVPAGSPTGSIPPQQILSGTVTDPANMPIPGVSVSLLGSKRGTTTDEAGRYAIPATPSDTLVFSFIGYQTVRLAAANQTRLDVQLEEGVTALGAVTINAGYYNTTQREATGSISRVTAEDIEMQPVVNPLAALQGRMAGVEIEQPSGITGLASSIRIRGRNSLRFTGEYPLFIVNGVPVNSNPLSSVGAFSSNSGIDPLNTLNMSNIESIEVLKDADATAIYGSRGANGVVLITTKRGHTSNGNTTFEAQVYSGFSRVSHRMDLLNTSQYLGIRNQAFANDGVTPTEINAPDRILWDQDRYTDWQKELMGETASVTDINLSVSGGNKNTSFLLGGSYHNEGAVFPGEFGYRKVTSNLNVHHTSDNKRFDLALTANYGIDHNKLFYGTNFVHMALTLPPNAPELYNADGSLNWADGSWTNPMAGLNRPQDIKTNSLLANLSLNYKLLKGLTIRANMGYSHLNSEEVVRNLLEAYNPSTWNRISTSSYHSTSERQSWILEPQLVYDAGLGKLNIDALAGATLQENKNNTLYLEGEGYSDNSLVGNLNAANGVQITTNEHIDYSYAAIFGRIGLNWSERYYLNLTGRRDGSSRFGPNNRFANFWAVGSAWIFSEEPFVKNNLSFLSFGKLRGSYGTTGSDQIPDYGYLDTYEATTGPGGLYPTKLYNPDFSWEVNKKLEAAIQLGFIKDRVNLEASWYRNRSSNQLIGYPLPAITGFTSVQANLPATIENTGWELLLSSRNFQRNTFSWQTSLNLTIPKNKLVEFDDLEQTSYRQTYKVGEPLNIAFLYQYDGIDPETGRYQIADVNDDGRYDFNDKVVIKSLGRKYYGGIQNTIRFNNFNLTFLLEYIRQDRYTYLAEMTNSPGRLGNNSTDLLNSWEQPGDPDQVQKVSQSIQSLFSYYNAIASDLVVGDASFLRLKTLSLSYKFPQRLLKPLGLNQCTLFLHGQNLFTITPYKGLDPQGGKVVPPLRTITSGIKITL
ncbi:SusC/RagA family TonB-linked outer membrane protein [Leeuwenhoekiella sp. A16]|uniref:SusC/RagA family TonB-linked outer membrane protein n=1 Tax=unclassified Leeuwenhoekiella TaxID=2615029 RepID=UPI003A803A56